MKSPMKSMFVVLAIVMSFVAVQGVCAETLTVEGTITTISSKPYMIVLDSETEVYGVRNPSHLLKECNIVLSVGDEVSVEAYEHECLDGTIKLKAVSITSDNITCDLR